MLIRPILATASALLLFQSVYALDLLKQGQDFLDNLGTGYDPGGS